MKCVKRMNIFFTIIAFNITTECASEFTKYSITKGRIEPMSGKCFFDSRWVHSGWECAFWCFQQNSPVCSFAAFYSTSGECKLFFWKDVKSVRLLLDADAPAADLYIGSDQKQMYLGSTQTHFAYTFVEGKKYCENIGGRLANLADLVTSRDNGWEVCSCGWLNDGRAHYLVSVPSTCNGQAHWQCSVSSHYGVHCIID